MSAWKNPSRNTCVKKISTPARASAGISTPFSRIAWTCEIGVPRMRSITMTRCEHRSQCTSGTRSSAEPSKLRRSWLALARPDHQVELLVEMTRESRHSLARPQPPAVDPQTFDQACRRVEQSEVPRHRGFDAGPENLDRDLASIVQGGEVHLGDRGARHGLAFERAEYIVNSTAQGALDLGDGELGRERRHPVLQARQLVGDVERNEVPARRKHLAELHVDGAQRLERLAQAPAARRAAAPGANVQPRPPGGARHELVQPEAQADPEDAQQPREPTQAVRPASRGARAHRAGARPRRRTHPPPGAP